MAMSDSNYNLDNVLDTFGGDDDAHSAAHDHRKLDILIWQKVDIAGALPSPCDGHISVCFESEMILFGGYANGQLTNKVATWDIRNSKWKYPECSGISPCPRSYSAGCLVDKYLIVHGGEGIPEDLLCRNDVCPGDSLGTRLHAEDRVSNIAGPATTKKLSLEGALPRPSECLDDMFALNLKTHAWYSIPSLLAPLPRKGHTLTYGKDCFDRNCLIIFGGYCKADDTFSNSIHLLVVDDLLAVIALAEGAQPNESPVIWQTIQFKDCIPPTPRYRHSATFLHGPNNSKTLIIFGGISNVRGQVVAMCDVHILDIDTIKWITVENDNHGFPSCHGGETPPPTYGHTAFPVIGTGCPHGEDEQGVGSGSGGGGGSLNLLVFGGSSNAAQSSLACQQALFLFNVREQVWTRIHTGILFPPQRCGHSAALLLGWAASNRRPNAQAVLVADMQLRPEVGGACVVIFGGSGATPCRPDLWILDLHWRTVGINQFDHSLHERLERSALAAITGAKMPEVEEKYLKASGSLKDLVRGGRASTSTSTFVDRLLGHTNGRVGTRFDPKNSNGHQQRLQGREGGGRDDGDGDGDGDVVTDATRLMQHGGTRSTPNLRPTSAKLPSPMASSSFLRQPIVADVTSRGWLDATTNPQKVKISKSKLKLNLPRPDDDDGREDLKTLPKRSQGLQNIVNPSVSSVESVRSVHDLDADLGMEEFAGGGTDTGPTHADGVQALRAHEMEEVGLAFLKVRKERAVADLHARTEAARAQRAEARVRDLEAELQAERQRAELALRAHEVECAQLRRALEQSAERERQLRDLNEESYHLLLLKSYQA